MPLFTPPTEEGQPLHDPDDRRTINKLLRHYRPHQKGVTVVREAGQWVEVSYPTINRLRDAEKVLLGGHVHEVTDAEAAELEAAGFGDRINIEDTELTFKPEQLARLSPKWLLTAQGSDATGPGAVDGHERGVFTLATGISDDFGNLREWFLHDFTEGWTDSHVICEGIDPPYFGEVEPSYHVIPQAGVVLRAQFDGTYNRGITINNGVFLDLPLLNIGVWQAHPDGSNFSNRQFSWPFFESLPLPYAFEAILTGVQVQVRIWAAGGRPPDWSHPTQARIINLDTDAGNAGAIPTPTDEGVNGLVVAHLGIDPRSQARLRRTTFRRIA